MENLSNLIETNKFIVSKLTILSVWAMPGIRSPDGEVLTEQSVRTERRLQCSSITERIILFGISLGIRLELFAAFGLIDLIAFSRHAKLPRNFHRKSDVIYAKLILVRFASFAEPVCGWTTENDWLPTCQ